MILKGLQDQLATRIVYMGVQMGCFSGDVLLMEVSVECGYLATGTVDSIGLVAIGDSSLIRNQIAIEAAHRLGVAPQDLRFDVSESFDDGPVHTTHDWRYTEPASWAQIIESPEARSFSVVA